MIDIGGFWTAFGLSSGLAGCNCPSPPPPTTPPAGEPHVHAELVRPALPAAVGGDGWGREAARERKADAVTQAEPGTMPVERGGEAGAERTEGTHGDPKALERRVHVLGGDGVLNRLLQDL